MVTATGLHYHARTSMTVNHDARGLLRTAMGVGTSNSRAELDFARRNPRGHMTAIPPLRPRDD
jgi:hypothetical protein